MGARAGMFVEPENDPRYEPPLVGDERTLLTGFLRWQRETLELKCSGLTPDELARRSVEPSTMSLLGLVRHIADVELGWFRHVMAGEDAPWHFRSEDNADEAFDGAVADPEVVAAAWEAWRTEIVYANELIAQAPDLDVTGTDPHGGEEFSLRWVLIHMIEEYARHMGHVDLLRERIDGALGE